MDLRVIFGRVPESGFHLRTARKSVPEDLPLLVIAKDGPHTDELLQAYLGCNRMYVPKVLRLLVKDTNSSLLKTALPQSGDTWRLVAVETTGVYHPVSMILVERSSNTDYVALLPWMRWAQTLGVDRRLYVKFLDNAVHHETDVNTEYHGPRALWNALVTQRNAP